MFGSGIEKEHERSWTYSYYDGTGLTLDRGIDLGQKKVRRTEDSHTSARTELAGTKALPGCPGVWGGRKRTWLEQEQKTAQ